MNRILCEKLDLTKGKAFLENIDTILCDCDGVLYHGESVIKGTIEVVKKFKSMNKRFIFATNNSLKTREQFAQKFQSMGYPANAEDVVCSSFVTSKTLKKMNYVGDVFCIGTSGFAEELKREGYKVEGCEGADISKDPMKDAEKYKPNPNIKCVVVGMDEHFNYLKACKAVSYLNQPGTLFISSNTDASRPISNNRILPGTGSILAMVVTAIQRQPDVICGKPHKPMYDVLKDQFNLTEEKTLMIGDRLDTDILFASNCGLRSLLVLTGISSLGDVEVCKKSSKQSDQLLIPEYYVDSIVDLLPMLQ